MLTTPTLRIYTHNVTPHNYIYVCVQTLSRRVQVRIERDQEGTELFCFRSSKLAFSCTAEVNRGPAYSD